MIEDLEIYSTNLALFYRRSLRDILHLDCARCFSSILIDGPVGQPSSFGRLSTTFALTFDKFGWDVYLEAWHKTNVERYGGRLLELYQKRRPRTYDLKLRVSHPDSFGKGHDVAYNLVLTAWESTHLPAFFTEKCDLVDVVFVPSVYNRDLFVSELYTITPIELFSHGIDPSVFYFVERPKDRKPFTFLFLATNTVRKNPRAALKAFNMAFPKQTYGANHVRLIMASTPPYPWDDLADSERDPRITFSYAARSDEQIRDLYAQSDCFVLPTRGEGFGLPLLEAMATGLPVITTDFGGAWDFCNPDLCYLARVNDMVRAQSPLTVKEGDLGMLAEVDKIHLSKLMKHVYENQEEAMAKGKASADEVKKNWTWDTVISTLFTQDLLCEAK